MTEKELYESPKIIEVPVKKEDVPKLKKWMSSNSEIGTQKAVTVGDLIRALGQLDPSTRIYQKHSNPWRGDESNFVLGDWLQVYSKNDECRLYFSGGEACYRTDDHCMPLKASEHEPGCEIGTCPECGAKPSECSCSNPLEYPCTCGVS